MLSCKVATLLRTVHPEPESVDEENVSVPIGPLPLVGTGIETRV